MPIKSDLPRNRISTLDALKAALMKPILGQSDYLGEASGNDEASISAALRSAGGGILGTIAGSAIGRKSVPGRIAGGLLGAYTGQAAGGASAARHSNKLQDQEFLKYIGDYMPAGHRPPAVSDALDKLDPRRLTEVLQGMNPDLTRTIRKGLKTRNVQRLAKESAFKMPEMPQLPTIDPSTYGSQQEGLKRYLELLSGSHKGTLGDARDAMESGFNQLPQGMDWMKGTVDKTKDQVLGPLLEALADEGKSVRNTRLATGGGLAALLGGGLLAGKMHSNKKKDSEESNQSKEAGTRSDYLMRFPSAVALGATLPAANPFISAGSAIGALANPTLTDEELEDMNREKGKSLIPGVSGYRNFKRMGYTMNREGAGRHAVGNTILEQLAPALSVTAGAGIGGAIAKHTGKDVTKGALIGGSIPTALLATGLLHGLVERKRRTNDDQAEYDSKGQFLANVLNPHQNTRNIWRRLRSTDKSEREDEESN